MYGLKGTLKKTVFMVLHDCVMPRAPCFVVHNNDHTMFYCANTG